MSRLRDLVDVEPFEGRLNGPRAELDMVGECGSFDSPIRVVEHVTLSVS